MANRLNLHLSEWKDDLAAEPSALATAAKPTLDTAAESAAQAVRSAYPSRETGNLRAGVRVDYPDPADPATVGAVVVSGAPHAHLYEDGTHVARPHPTFWPITDEHARSADRDVAAMMDARGYTVSGQGT